MPGWFVVWGEGENGWAGFKASIFAPKYLLSTFVTIALVAQIRKLRKHASSKSSLGVAVVACLWVALIAGMLGVFVFRAIGVLYAHDAVAGMPNPA